MTDFFGLIFFIVVGLVLYFGVFKRVTKDGCVWKEPAADRAALDRKTIAAMNPIDVPEANVIGRG